MSEGDEPEKRFSAFISHASEDAEYARELTESLERRGLACWIAPRDLRPGAEYGEGIVAGIKASRCLVLVLSEHANRSAMVRREVERAVSLKLPVVPIRLDADPALALKSRSPYHVLRSPEQPGAASFALKPTAFAELPADVGTVAVSYLLSDGTETDPVTLAVQ